MGPRGSCKQHLSHDCISQNYGCGITYLKTTMNVKIRVSHNTYYFLPFDKFNEFTRNEWPTRRHWVNRTCSVVHCRAYYFGPFVQKLNMDESILYFWHTLFLKAECCCYSPLTDLPAAPAFAHELSAVSVASRQSLTLRQKGLAPEIYEMKYLNCPIMTCMRIRYNNYIKLYFAGTFNITLWKVLWTNLIFEIYISFTR